MTRMKEVSVGISGILFAPFCFSVVDKVDLMSQE